jgi:hypothetical protein
MRPGLPDDAQEARCIRHPQSPIPYVRTIFVGLGALGSWRIISLLDLPCLAIRERMPHEQHLDHFDHEAFPQPCAYGLLSIVTLS